MIIVTGAAGFIGSQIAKNFAGDLVAVDRLESFHDRKYREASQFLVELHKLRNVRWVIHMGAITNTAETDVNQLKKWNVDYSKAIWKYCTENKVNLIYASSAATYGSGSEGFSDDHASVNRLKPLNLYGKSKQEFDLFVLSQTKTPPHWYGVKYFNVFGPHEDHKGRMASAIWHGYNEIKKTGAMTLFRSHNDNYKDGEQARDFIYIEDVLKIIKFLIEKKPTNGIYNVGTGRAGTFMELAQSLFKALGKPIKINWVDTPQEFRSAYQYRTEAEIHKLRAAGYSESFMTLEAGVADYLKYLK